MLWSKPWMQWNSLDTISVRHIYCSPSSTSRDAVSQTEQKRWTILTTAILNIYIYIHLKSDIQKMHPSIVHYVLVSE